MERKLKIEEMNFKKDKIKSYITILFFIYELK